MLLSLASHRASPGVTTAALGLAQLAVAAGWTDVLFVEADADGAVVRFLQPDLDPDNTLLTYGIAARRSRNANLLDEHAQPLSPRHQQPRLLISPDTGVQVARSIDLAGQRLIDAAGQPGKLVIVDCGRLSNVAATLFHAADRKLLLVGSTAAEVLSLQALIAGYPDQAQHVDLVLVGGEPYGADDLASIGMAPVATLPYDPKTAEVLRGTGTMPPKRFLKAPLVEALNTLVPAPEHGDHSWTGNSVVDDNDPVDELGPIDQPDDTAVGSQPLEEVDAGVDTGESVVVAAPGEVVAGEIDEADELEDSVDDNAGATR